MNEVEVIKRSRGRAEIWFPGRWAGGGALILGPLLLLAGVALRLPFHFFFPQQLEAFRDHPALMTASYSLFAAGNLLLWPAVLTLVRLIGGVRPYWAMWGGIFAICGLFARTFHAGVDHLAFQLVRSQGLDSAVKAVSEAYGAFHLFSIFNLAILLGWIVLAAGAYLSRTMNRLQSIALGLMAALPLGVLKGTTPSSLIAAAGLCLALMPLGLQVLRDGPPPRLRTAAAWFLLIAAAGGFFYFFGQAG